MFCQDQSDLSFVADSFCDQSTKPSSGENCLVNCTQDCVVSAWGEWDQQCSNTCGDSLKTRQRTILKQPSGLGRTCPSLLDKQLCHEPPCTSFTWKVGIWNTCKLTSQGGVCGNGTQTRQVSCSPDPAREWICAKQAEKPAMVQECSLACPGMFLLCPGMSSCHVLVCLLAYYQKCSLLCPSISPCINRYVSLRLHVYILVCPGISPCMPRNVPLSRFMSVHDFSLVQV